MRIGAFQIGEPLPELREPHALVMLHPWVDIGGVGSTVLELLEDYLGAMQLGKLSQPGDFFDFTRYRLVIHLVEGQREIEIPNSYINYAKYANGNDFLFFHIKETDNLSHDHKPEKIVRLLEEIDEKVIKKFLTLDPSSHVIAVTADHTTSSIIGEHVGDPVPVTIWGAGVRTDPVSSFDEYSCARGGLCRIKGKNLIYILMDLINRMKKFGA